MPDQNPLRLLRASINGASDVVRHKDTFVFTMPGFKRKFKADLVNQFDGRIGVVVDYLNKNNFSLSSGTLLRKTLNHWMEPGVILENKCDTYYMTRINMLTPLGDENKFSVTCNRYKTVRLESNLDVVVAVIKNSDYRLTTNWLNNNFNGLATKFLTLTSLGVEPKEATRQALAELHIMSFTVDMEKVQFG